jgi:predicted RNase H-like nuclease (RuvC/YqgF family)
MEMKYSGKKSGISLDLSSELNSLKRQLSEKNNDIEELEGQMAEYKRITN